jgi:hypothetical protein
VGCQSLVVPHAYRRVAVLISPRHGRARNQWCGGGHVRRRCGRGAGKRRHGGSGPVGMTVGADLHGGNKAIAIAVDGADYLLRPTGVANGPACRPHGAFEGRVTDELLGPDLLAQLLLQDGAVPMLQQVEEDLHDFGPQPHRLAGTLQPMLLRVEETRPEPVDHRTSPRGSLTPLTADRGRGSRGRSAPYPDGVEGRSPPGDASTTKVVCYQRRHACIAVAAFAASSGIIAGKDRDWLVGECYRGESRLSAVGSHFTGIVAHPHG